MKEVYGHSCMGWSWKFRLFGKNDVVFQYIFVLLAEKKTRYIPCLYLVFFYMYFKWTEVL